MSGFDERAKSWDTEDKRSRAKTVAGRLKEYIDLSQVRIAMEYGCGTGLLSFELVDEIPKVVLADSSRGMIEVADAKIAAAGADHFTTQILDLTANPSTEGSFDLIYTMLTLHHIPDTDTILRTFHGMLNTGGALVVIDLDAEDGSFHGPDMDVHHGFDRDSLKRDLLGAGFSLAKITDCNQLRRNSSDYQLFIANARK